jgi:adenylate cyclase
VRPVPESWFAGGSVPIDFAYPAGTIPTVSLSRVWRGAFDPAQFRGPDRVRGRERSVAPGHPRGRDDWDDVGRRASGERDEHDAAAHPAPRRSNTLDIVLIVLFGLVQPLVSMRMPRPRWVAIAPAIAALYVIAVQIAFNHGMTLDLVDPLVALALATMGSLAVLYLTETIERERVRGLFARFVPASVVEQVLARTDENLRLGAVQRDSTGVFSDLRGFTAFSEGQHPQRVLDVVNFYLAEMTDAILAAGGTLIAYMGDGIMALFGAPLEVPGRAEKIAVWSIAAAAVVDVTAVAADEAPAPTVNP